MDRQKIVCCVFFIAVGIFSLAGAVFDWDFFFNARKSRRIVNIIGRKGARIFYGILGVFIIAMGVAVLVVPE